MLLGVARGDTTADAERLARKVANLRIFENEGKFDRSLLDWGGAALIVSNFTLVADTAKGNRPDFSKAAPREQAEPLYEHFCQALRDLGVESETGVFGARMAVEVVNDGPRRARHRLLTLTGCADASRQSAAAILQTPHFTGFTKWARGAHLFCRGQEWRRFTRRSDS